MSNDLIGSKGLDVLDRIISLYPLAALIIPTIAVIVTLSSIQVEEGGGDIPQKDLQEVFIEGWYDGERSGYKRGVAQSNLEVYLEGEEMGHAGRDDSDYWFGYDNGYKNAMEQLR